MLFLYLFKHSINRYLIFKNLSEEYKSILQDCFIFYQQLSSKDKLHFERRLQRFIDRKHFIPEGDLKEVTPEMKTLIGASAIQLTFGLPGVYFKNFKFIHVYPDFYFSEDMLQFNAGEVHKSGHIFLSWKDFLEGYMDPSNGRNIGLHEMAHALRLENMIKNEEYQYLKWSDIELINQLTVEETEKIQSGITTIFREYAATNYHEFFAVLIEVFFEQPRLLYNYHPELYIVTTRLLRQDLLASKNKLA